VLPRTDFHGTKLNVRRGATRTGLCILLATTCFLVACYSVSSKSDVVGAYELSGASGKLALDLFSDGRFVESIEDSKSSTVQKQTGNMVLEWRQNKFRQSLDTGLIRAQGDSVCRLAQRSISAEIHGARTLGAAA
jgi:hypothetical protein